jgi:uncharacterized repeat protein (TIGR04052 family)
MTVELLIWSQSKLPVHYDFPPTSRLDFDRGSFMLSSRFAMYCALLLSFAAQGCSPNPSPDNPVLPDPIDDGGPKPFALKFALTANGQEIGCTDTITGLGADGKQTIGLNDVRFFISNMHFFDAEDNHVEYTLDQNEFQYVSPEGSAFLVDLTSNTEGNCKNSAVTRAEGTPRTHVAITGKTFVEDVFLVLFDVGVQQALMKETVTNNNAENAPSPLEEMYWSWSGGYRHFVMNFTVDDGQGETGDGYVHLESRECGPMGGKPFEDRDQCTFMNTPNVILYQFDLQKDTVAFDIAKALSNLDFRAPTYDPVTSEVIGEGPGVDCRSSAIHPDCSSIFANFGLDLTTGEVVPLTQKAFSRK